MFSLTARRCHFVLSAHAYLHENNSYHYFSDLGDLIVTGATGTNVMDLQISLIR